MAGIETLLKGILVVIALLSPFCVQSKPMGGKFVDSFYSFNNSEGFRINGSCHMIGMYQRSNIQISGKLNFTKSGTDEVKFGIVAKLFKLRCANLLQLVEEDHGKHCECSPHLEDDYADRAEQKLVAVINKTMSESATVEFKFHVNNTIVKPAPTPKPEDTQLDDTRPKNTTNPTLRTTPTGTADSETVNGNISSTNRRKRAEDRLTPKDKEPEVTTEKEKPKSQDMENGKHGVVAMTINDSGVYLLQLYIERLGEVADSSVIRADVNIEMKNPHGYLSAVDYPALVFYGIMTSVYTIFGIAWIVMMLCSFNDLVRLQYWVLAVIILGFLEKTFFVAEYSAINLGRESLGSYVIAEFVSAVKRGLSRMLLIIVAMGFGTVKPRLGDSLLKVVAVGVAYFVLALIDGIMRSRADTFHTSDTSSMVTLVLLLLLDTFIFYWIFTSIVDTRRTLRLRKNYVKLAMYNHFAYTLIFAIVATVAFIIWVFVALEYPAGLCLTDWREVWLRDCFWHVLFAFILLVVMVIWRPSSNRSRFAYSLVTDADDDEVLFEQGNNKNFDTVKMRSVSKSGDPPPPPVSQAEDDLRWVEENLPTTAMDKALPLLLDSDEEVMTTKFEMSKMN